MIKNIVISSLVAAFVALAVSYSADGAHRKERVAPPDPVLERVERTNTVRCGYVSNPPFISLDPNTHALSGIMVDVAEKIGSATGWTIDWSSESTYATMAEDMAAGKFDVFCGGSWPIATGEKRQWWAGPLFYSAVAAFARADDPRFGPTFALKDLNTPKFSISVLDGVAVDRVRAIEFPNARAVSLPNTSGYGDMITQVTEHKADVVLIELETAYRYMANNPGTIKRIGGEKPIRLYGIGYEFPFDAPQLRNVFEAALRELVDGGDIDRILTKYEDRPGMFYRVAPHAEIRP